MTDIATLRRRVLLVGPGVLLFLLPFHGFIENLSYTYQLIPFVLSMVFLGLPHGAMDHLVPAKLAGVPVLESALKVSLLYLVVGGVYVAWWFVDAVTALLFFLVLTLVHWGQGDLHALKELQGETHSGTTVSNVLHVLVRGGIPMLVPLIAHPELYVRFLSSVLSLFSETPGTIVFPAPIRLSALLFIGGLTIASSAYHLFSAVDKDSLRHWAYTQFETVTLWLCFLTLPPVFVVGVYFCVWHSLRHIARISLVEGGGLRELLMNQEYTSYLRSVLWQATPLTVVSLLGIAGTSFIALSSFNAAESVIAVYLVCISVLTLPHFIIVSWMDYEENVWR